MGGCKAAWTVSDPYGAAVGHLCRVGGPGLVLGEAYVVEGHQLCLQVRPPAQAWEYW